MSVVSRALVSFPASVVGGDGITITKSNGVFTISALGSSSAPFAAMVNQNFIHNGGMDVAQLNGTTAITATFQAGSYTIKKTVDRWLYECRGSAVTTLQQVSDAPAGLTKSIKLTVGTVQATMAAPDSCTLFQFIELANFARAGFGAAGALPITLFFWVKAHRTGQYGGTFKNELGNRIWGYHFTVHTADTWEYKTVTVEGDTSGQWTTGGNLGAFFMVSQATGATLGSCADSSWGTQNGSNVSGSVNAIASLTDTFQLTGVGAVIGSQAPSQTESVKLIRSQNDALFICRRYLRKDVQPPLVGQMNTLTLAARMSMPLVPQMRVAPNLYMYGNLGVVNGPALDSVSTLGTNFSTTDALQVHMNITGVGTPSNFAIGNSVQVYQDGGAVNYLISDAEYFNNLATP